MRLSEKTIELNICAEIARTRKPRTTWFGLTQKQEAEAGFDACAKLGGRLVLLQFKASSHQTKAGRRFNLPHDQLVALAKRCSGFPRSVLYVFPLIGTTSELQGAHDFLSNTWFLDVSALLSLGAPTRIDGALRKTGVHYCDVTPGLAVIHSEPTTVTLRRWATLTKGIQEVESPPFLRPDGFDVFWRSVRPLIRHSVAAIL